MTLQVNHERVEVVERRPDRVIIRLKWVPMVSGRQDPTEIKLTLGALDRGVHVQVTFPASRGIAAARSVGIIFGNGFCSGFLIGESCGVYRARPGFPPRAIGCVSSTPWTARTGWLPWNRITIATSSMPRRGLQEKRRFLPAGVELRPRASQATIDRWTSFSSMQTAASYESERRALAFQIYANDLPFPVHHAENFIAGEDKGKDDAQAQRDSAAYFTAVYGSAVGVVGSYAEPGSAYPTLASPDRPYGDAFDFFDPDAWSTVTALSYSGDPLLQAEARRILERSESFQRPDGQMPHHFEAGAPTLYSPSRSRARPATFFR